MREDPHPSAVFDCMVFLQGAARRESPAGVCLGLAQVGAVELFTSDQVIAEIREVLTRPALRGKFPVLRDEYVEEFLAAMRATTTHVHDVHHSFDYARDPKDEPYLNLAVAARVDYLVTRDTDLLDLADPANPEGQRIRELHPELLIVDPVRFLREILILGKTSETT